MAIFHTSKSEGYSSVFREAVDTIRSSEQVNVLTAEGLREAMGDPSLFRQYKGLLSEGMTAESAENFSILADNYQLNLFREASLSGIEPMSTLTLPMLRKAWPKIGIKEALPTQPVKTPKFTVSNLVPYIKDNTPGASGAARLELPQALRAGLTSSQPSIATAARTLPLNNFDLATGVTGVDKTKGDTVDPVFAITAVDITVLNADGSATDTYTNVAIYTGQAETRQGNIRFTVSQGNAAYLADPTSLNARVTSDTVYGWVDFAAGTLTLSSINSAISTTAAKITKIYISGRFESTGNTKSTTISFDIKTTEIHIGTGEHFDAALPLEWLQDNLAMYNIDGTLKVIDIMTEVIAQKVDIQGIDFVKSAYNHMQAMAGNAFFSRTFDVFPTGNYMGSPTEWLNEIKRITDNLAQSMRNYTNFSGGTFMIVGNPIDINLYAGVNWIFTAQTDASRDGVDVNYSIGALSGAQRYAMFSSQNITAGEMLIFFVPGQEDIATLKYYPYTFNVERSSSGFVSPNSPNVPSVLLTKRQAFQEFVPLVGKIVVLNNSGTLPA
jgi:hypothetical protein